MRFFKLFLFLYYFRFFQLSPIFDENSPHSTSLILVATFPATDSSQQLRVCKFEFGYEYFNTYFFFGFFTTIVWVLPYIFYLVSPTPPAIVTNVAGRVAAAAATTRQSENLCESPNLILCGSGICSLLTFMEKYVIRYVVTL